MDCAAVELPQLRRGGPKARPRKGPGETREQGAGLVEITVTFRSFDAESEEEHRALVDIFNRGETLRLRLNGREFQAERITKIPTEDDLTMVVKGRWVDS